jgi:hypothetical protein
MNNMRYVSLAVALGLATIAGLPSSAWAGRFRPPVYYPDGSGGFQVISAVFTSSGNVDLAIADFYASQVRVLLGNGDGTFQKAREFSVPSPLSLATGDFDEDGKLDLAVVEFNGAGAHSVLHILLGNGDGTFRAGAHYQLGIQTSFLALADFDGDGHLDVAAEDSGDGKNSSVMVFLGTGKGTFKKPTRYKVTGGPAHLTAGDLNGDHHPDLAVGQFTDGSVAVLLNDGTGKFHEPVSYWAGGGGVEEIAIADLRHDGRNDLAVVNASLNEIAILLNHGDGSFAPAKFYISGFSWGTGTNGVVIADFNLDGNLDLAASNQNGNSALLYGKGDGTFKAAIPIHDEIKFDGAFGLTVGDFNNDQAPDLAFAMYFKPKLAILLNTR